MKWWKASLVVVLSYLVLVAVEVGWHRYIATDLPLAALMRHLYLSRTPEGHYTYVSIPDFLFPVFAMGIALGAAARSQRPAFVLAHALLVAAGLLALLPFYARWFQPPPPAWREYPLGWNAVALTYLFSLVCVSGAAFGTWGNLRNQLRASERKKLAQTQPGGKNGSSARIGQESVGADQRPISSEGAPTYTLRQIDGIILVMCARGWSIKQAAKNFRINPEDLRERWRDFAPRCTPEQISAIVGVMREKGWTVEETAKRFRIPKEMLIKGMEGEG